MRVCFVSHSAGKGGAEFALLELLQGLIVEGVDCKVLVPKKGPLLAALDQLHIEWKIIGYPPWWVTRVRRRWMPGRILRTVRTLLLAVPMAKIIAKWECDLVYSNTVAAGAGALAARLAKRPHVWHLHEFGYRDPNLLFDLGKRRTAHMMDRLSTIFIANSYAVVNDYARYINRDKMKVIYQAVTLPNETESSRGDHTTDRSCFTCVIVGSLHIAKGQDEAIRALAEVVRRGIDAELLLIGGSGRRFRKALAQQARDFNLEQRVRFIGYVENPIPYIRMADVVLVCSRWEAFGRATVEAMLTGKPIIATANSGGTTELIHNGKTGLLYEAGDHVELADKIQHLYQSPEEGARLGTAAHIWATGRFTQQRYAKEVLNLLSEALTEGCAAPANNQLEQSDD
ncbi:glycosyltransferase family 4 protein [Nitrosospira sp. NRS527]|uniref:glycosyltransferase family 4 protein n=1 Tax=Nitrosospira sp. NRS527 TaxID=155925 RepID=UPI001AF8EBCE|nr:glycosyltransferase family 4 protein [Nitrosospira sp. NRS527]BCT67971.1 D-inositol-3-phosphate glycosyltransferase [Nitrosospira sp. NRS527]